VHYIYGCTEMRRFWNGFTNWWNNIFGANICINKKDVIVGITDDIDKNRTLNICILMAKWFIYKSKLNETQVFFYTFLCDLKYNLIIEKTIALRNNQLHKYIEMWDLIEDNIT
jgi:hypothetical protein